MKRFYIKRIADYITIVHRPSHQIIMMGEMNEEMGKNIKRFINMTTEEFYKELHSLGLKFKTNKSYQEDIDKEKEDWYEKAWIYTTNQVLDNYMIKEDSIPEEEVPYELIEELQRREETSWNIEETKEEVKEAPEEKVKEKHKKRTLKKRKRLPKKIKNEKAVTLVPYKSKQEVRSAYIAGEIDLETLKKYMKALKS
jgi:hypothetical protein